MGKALVLCYSFEGNTLNIAKAISAALQIDLYEIKPVKELKSTGFSKFIWGGRQVVLQKKPELLPITIDLSTYDLVFLGSPIWVGTFAPAIKTLLEDGLLHDKKIAYFYTHEGGAKNASEKGKKSIEKYNQFIGSISLLDVMKQPDVCKDEAVKWATQILKIK
jgi:flavodoxin